MSKRFATFVYLFTLVFFACFFLLPIIEILKGGFFDNNGHFSLGYLKAVFANPIYVEGLRNAFAMGFFSTILALLLALPLAYFADKYDFPLKSLFMSLVLLPIMLPPFVGAIGIQKILGTYGAFNAILLKIGLLAQPVDWIGKSQFWCIIVLNALSYYPILYLNTLASLANIDPAMEEAAGSFGCVGLKRFFKITLPLMRPGLFAGCTIVFIWSFTELGVPLIFDYNRITPVQIYNGLKEISGNPFPYALVSVMLFFSVFCYAVGKGLFGRNTFVMMSKATHASANRQLGPFRKVLAVSLFSALSIFALLPHLAVILFSFSSDWYATILPEGWTTANYIAALGHDLTVPAIKNSLIYASFATVLAVVIGTSVAFVVVRTKLPGRHFLDSITMLPLAIPGLVMAFGYLAISQRGRIFESLNPIQNPTILLIIAYAVRKLPFMVRSAVSGLQQSSPAYEEAAQNLGCKPLKASLKITLPLIMANLMAGGLLVFSQTMLEVSDSIILAQKQQFFPITKAIYELMSLLGEGPYLACALGVWAMTFLAITVWGASKLMGKNLGAIFKV
ncbi:MAG: ABC transporter permease [Verrucomicrobia bacterium GWF2_51_19]|nr:MAG: ABC transporter permease [Verrucomicrobia bacterium GWF2_51_19]HCJ11904.1 ABC transporter permease [Opitutae bacterium]